MRILLAGLLCLSFAPPAPAEEEPRGKFTVSGDVVTYSTESNGGAGEIEDEDVDDLLAVLKGSPGITKLVLNSGGGSVWAGIEMARITLDFELDTEVTGECSSSCVSIFLAGENRSMTRGSKIGFHSRSWSPEAIESYYQKWREDEDWETPFEFGSWVYRDTQAETYEDLMYILSRGVDAQFAIKTKAPRDSTWYPRRSELRQAGVLTE